MFSLVALCHDRGIAFVVGDADGAGFVATHRRASNNRPGTGTSRLEEEPRWKQTIMPGAPPACRSGGEESRPAHHRRARGGRANSARPAASGGGPRGCGAPADV